MSGLVEKVSRIIDPASWQRIDDYLSRPEGSALHMAGVNYRDMALTKARLAIKAVAGWLSAQENSDLSWAAIEILQAQLEGSK
jgi:hypothetical protein